MLCFISKIQQFELPSFHSAWHQNRNAVSWKKGLSSWFSENVNSRCFVEFRQPYWCTKTVHQYGVSIQSGCKGARNVSANIKSETVGRKDLRLGQIVYILVFYNISFSWLLPLDGFQFIFLLHDGENDLYVRCTVRHSRIRSEMSWSSTHTKIRTLKHLHHYIKRLNHEDM